MPGTKPGSDKPTGRVVVVIVLLMLAGAALRGHLPADDGAPLAAAGGSRAALMFIVAALAATLALIALAIITRLRHPLPVAPSAGELSAMLGGCSRASELACAVARTRDNPGLAADCDTAGTVVRAR